MQCGPGRAHLGAVEVTNHVLAYQRKRASTNATIDVVPLDLPRLNKDAPVDWDKA